MQIAQGRNLAVSVLSHREMSGYTAYLIETVAAASDGRRSKPMRVEKRVTEFRTLHQLIIPALSPLIPTVFPISSVPRLFQTAKVVDSRMESLESYLRLAIESSDGNLPAELQAFLGLPKGGAVFDPLQGGSGGGGGGGKQVAPADWEFPSAKLIWVREIGQGGFGTVFEVGMGGQTWAAKKSTCTVPSEREAIVTMYRKEFRALKEVQHPNIVQLIGVCVDDPKSVSLLMELAPLGSLRSLLNSRASEVVGILSTQRQLLHGIAAGMACLHAHTS